MARLSFIIVNCNGGELLRHCLDSVRSQTLSDHEVVVVDNGSSDFSCRLPHFAEGRYRLIQLDRNTGFAAANNIGFENTTAPLVALVNNDVRLTADWAEEMVGPFVDDGVAAAACRLLQTQQPERLDSAGFAQYAWGSAFQWFGWPGSFFSGRPHAPFGAVASAAVYRRSALKETGVFRPSYFAYYEDNDLAMRLVLRGYRCAYVDRAVAYHLGGGTGKRMSAWHRYYLRRNIELLFWVNMVGRLAWKHALAHLLYESLCMVGMLVKGQGGVFLRAKRDALKMLPWIVEQRRCLRRELQAAGMLARARKTLESQLSPVWSVWSRAGRSPKAFHA